MELSTSEGLESRAEGTLVDEGTNDLLPHGFEIVDKPGAEYRSCPARPYWRHAGASCRVSRRLDLASLTSGKHSFIR